MVFVRIFLRVFLKHFFHTNSLVFVNQRKHYLTIMIVALLQGLNLAQNKLISFCFCFAFDSTCVVLTPLGILEKQADDSFLAHKISLSLELFNKVAVNSSNGTLGFRLEAG